MFGRLENTSEGLPGPHTKRSPIEAPDATLPAAKKSRISPETTTETASDSGAISEPQEKKVIEHSHAKHGPSSAQCRARARPVGHCGQAAAIRGQDVRAGTGG